MERGSTGNFWWKVWIGFTSLFFPNLFHKLCNMYQKSQKVVNPSLFKQKINEKKKRFSFTSFLCKIHKTIENCLQDFYTFMFCLQWTRIIINKQCNFSCRDFWFLMGAWGWARLWGPGFLALKQSYDKERYLSFLWMYIAALDIKTHHLISQRKSPEPHNTSSQLFHG